MRLDRKIERAEVGAAASILSVNELGPCSDGSVDARLKAVVIPAAVLRVHSIVSPNKAAWANNLNMIG